MKVLIGNAKGPKGDTGSKGDKGDKGNTGQRGSRWISGTGITGTSTIGTKFPDSGITDAQLFDYYINTDTGNLYECTVPGTADIAEWVYMSNFKGPKGDTGLTGSISDINVQKPTYSESSELKNIESGETVQISFGKLKKAVSVLISHYMQEATQSILGHVKLSNSAAITTAGEYALDAIEKNASVAGTLANMIGQINSNLLAIEIPYELKNGWKWSSGAGITRIGNTVNICLGILNEDVNLVEGSEILQLDSLYMPNNWVDIPAMVAFNTDNGNEFKMTSLNFFPEKSCLCVGNQGFSGYFIVINASWIIAG